MPERISDIRMFLFLFWLFFVCLFQFVTSLASQYVINYETARQKGLNEEAHPDSHYEIDFVIDFVNKIVTNTIFFTKDLNSASDS